VEDAAAEVSSLISKPERNQIVHAYHKCIARLDQIDFPRYKIHFLFANYAFENLREEQLKPIMHKCIDHMEVGGVIFMKEPHPF